MRGIRDLAMGSEEPEYVPSRSSNLNAFGTPNKYTYNSKEKKMYDATKGYNSGSLFSDEEREMGRYNPELDNNEDYNTDDYTSTSYGSYKEPKAGTITINMILPLKELGRICDEYDEKYDWEKSIEHTKKVAISKIDALLHKNYDDYSTYYDLEVDVTEGFEENEVDIKLIPKKD